MASYFIGITKPFVLDWELRRNGRLSPTGSGTDRGVRERAIEQNLQFVLAVMNWALVAGDGRGNPLLDRNPFQGLPLPKEKNPVRVILSDEEYGALLAVGPEVGWRFETALVLAHETGHRIGAIRQLRWSDIEFESRTIRWRADAEPVNDNGTLYGIN